MNSSQCNWPPLTQAMLRENEAILKSRLDVVKKEGGNFRCFCCCCFSRFSSTWTGGGGWRRTCAVLAVSEAACEVISRELSRHLWPGLLRKISCNLSFDDHRHQRNILVHKMLRRKLVYRCYTMQCLSNSLELDLPFINLSRNITVFIESESTCKKRRPG